MGDNTDILPSLMFASFGKTSVTSVSDRSSRSTKRSRVFIVTTFFGTSRDSTILAR